MYEQTGTLVRSKFREHLLPTVLTTMALSMATVIDGIIVGQLLGADALAAIGLSSPMIYCMNIIYLLFGAGGMMCASVARGRWETQKANGLFSAAYLFGVLAMLLFCAVTELFLSPICMALAGGNEGVAALTAMYLRPMLFTGPALMLSSGMSLFMRADGKPKSSAMVVVVANAVNLVLDYVLIQFCNTGIMGAGLSTTLGYVFGFFLVLPYLFNIKNRRSFRFVRPAKIGKTLKEITLTGLPKGCTYIASLGRSLVLNGIIISALGALGMSVMTVLINVLTIANIFVSGTCDTLLPIVGTLYGERDTFGIRKTVESARNVLIGAVIFLMALFLFFPRLIGGLFALNTPEASAMLTPALRMFAFYMPFYATVTTLQNFYNTTDRKTLATTIAVLDGFLYVCLFAVLFVAVSPSVFWLCFAAGSCATFVTVLLVGCRIRKKSGVTGLLLLRENEENSVVWNRTLTSYAENAVGLSQQIMEFCAKQGVDRAKALQLGVAIEEMVLATAHFSHKDTPSTIDMMLRITENEILLRFRDNGVAFDPLEYTPSETDGFMTDGIAVMKALVQEMQYTRQLGFNTTVLTLQK